MSQNQSYMHLSYPIDERQNSRRLRFTDKGTLLGRKSLTSDNFPAAPKKPGQYTKVWTVFNEVEPEMKGEPYPFRVCAHTKPRIKENKNRDRMSIATTNDFAALIMVDGFGRDGDIISTRLRDNLAIGLFEMQLSLIRDKDPKVVISQAVSKLEPIDQTKGMNGASATLAVVFPDGTARYALVGNCPAYLIGNDNNVRRLGKSEKVRIVRKGIEDEIVDPTALDCETYVENDGNLITAVRSNSLAINDIDSGRFELTKGDRLVVLSSGLVRNLPIVVNEGSGLVIDSSRVRSLCLAASGSPSLDAIVERLLGMEIGADEVRKIEGNVYTRNFDKDRSVVAIERAA